MADEIAVLLGLHRLVQCNSDDDQAHLLDSILPRTWSVQDEESDLDDWSSHHDVGLLAATRRHLQLHSGAKVLADRIGRTMHAKLTVLVH